MRFSLRSLRRAPGFALAAIVTLALGIGLSTAVFTVADALLIRRLPVVDQDRLVTLWGAKRDGSIDHWPLELRSARDFARQARTLRGVAYSAYEGAWPVAVREGNTVTRLRRALVSGNWFDVLGARPLIGRALRTSDDVVGAAPVVVISHDTWQRQFGGEADVTGRSLTLEEFGVTAKIVGVMPAGLEYPKGADFWAPFVPSRLKSENDTTAYTALDLVGRLAPNASLENAREELTSFFMQPGQSSAQWRGQFRGVAHPLPRVILGDTRAAVLVFAAAAVLLLLITCINVANLLLVRGLARVREIGIRAALGASRRQIVTQLLAENGLLGLGGAMVGVLLAWAAVQGLIALAPAGMPLIGTVSINLTALGGALAITLVAMLVFGLAPAIVTSRADAQAALRSGGGRHGATRRGRMARETLVAAQLGVALLVLSAAALLGRSFLELRGADLEFDSPHLLVAELAIHYDEYGTTDKQLALLDRLVARVGKMPGVQALSPVVAVPFSGTAGWTGHAGLAGQSKEAAAKNPTFNMEVVTPDYFRTFGLRLLRGRGFTGADRQGGDRVAVISERMAREYWPGADAIGKRIYVDRPDQLFTVIGIAPDTRYRDLRDAPASVYFALAQSPFPFVPTTLAIRVAGSPAALVPALRRAIGETASGVTVASAASFDSYMEGPLSEPRLNAYLLGIFAIAAAALAAIGLFSTMATMVRQRTREIGVRMALGATARGIQRAVIARGLAIAGAGVGLGLIGALFMDRLLASLLYGVRATDALTLAGAAGFLTAIALLASFIPSRTSARVDPAIALRADG